MVGGCQRKPAVHYLRWSWRELYVRHGIANCIAFNHLEEFYGGAVQEFKDMVAFHNIDLPQNLSAGWSDEEISKMADVAYNLPHMWTHAMGHDWEKKLTKEYLIEVYRRM